MLQAWQRPGGGTRHAAVGKSKSTRLAQSRRRQTRINVRANKSWRRKLQSTLKRPSRHVCSSGRSAAIVAPPPKLRRTEFGQPSSVQPMDGSDGLPSKARRLKSLTELWPPPPSVMAARMMSSPYWIATSEPSPLNPERCNHSKRRIGDPDQSPANQDL